MPLVDPGNTGRESFVEHLNLQMRNDKEVRGVLRDTQKFVQREIRTIPGNSVSAQVRRAQYQQVDDAIVRHTTNGWKDIGDVLDGNIARSAQIAGDGAAALVDVLGASLPDELLAGMQAAADSSGERVAARIANRIDLSPRIYDNARLTAGHVDRIINQSIASNSSAKELARAVATYISPDAPGGMSYCAMRLGRTELNNAFHATNKALYENQPWVDGAKWLLSGSHPKPDECNEYAEGNHANMGQGVYRSTEVPGKPHPQCLCYTVPITPSRKDFHDQLLSGQFNNWLEENGLEPL